MFGLGRIRPGNLGVTDGKLAECPSSPNCVSTQATSESHRIEPLKLAGSPDELLAAVGKIVSEKPRWKVVTETDDYVHIECTSLICRYVDDLEVWADEFKGQVHARSASRVGYSDMGVNRKRVEDLFGRLGELGIANASAIKSEF